MTQHLQIIALTGSAGAGKDTAADILVTHCNFTRLAFADALRAEVQAAFRVPPELLTHREAKELPAEALAYISCTDMGFIGAMARHEMKHDEVLTWRWLTTRRSPRQILQGWGTEYRRAQRVTYWLDLLRERINQLHALDGRTRFVITDCRFENEADMVRGMGGVLWQVVRDGLPNVEHGHASATDGSKLDPAVVIYNSGSLHNLREDIFCEWLTLETKTDVESVRLRPLDKETS